MCVCVCARVRAREREKPYSHYGFCCEVMAENL
jgi:hypothetical protein